MAAKLFVVVGAVLLDNVIDGKAVQDVKRAGQFQAGRGAELVRCGRVHVTEGQPASLQPYMGMLGHAVVRRSDGEVFTHLHPVGTISMAAQEVLSRQPGSALAIGPPATNELAALIPRRPAGPSSGARNEVTFPYAFPRAGDYRLWVQVRINGRVLTGVFDARVQPAR